MKLQAQGMMPFMVGDPEGFIDITPVDVVSEAIVHALFGPDEGKTISATSGVGAPRFAEFLTAQTHALNRARHSAGLARNSEPPIIDYESYCRRQRPMLKTVMSRHQQTMLRSVEFFIPYLCVPGPIPRPDSDPWFASPPHETYLGKGMAYWCERHKSLIAGKGYVGSDAVSQTGKTPDPAVMQLLPTVA
jgi:hypothetical protein